MMNYIIVLLMLIVKNKVENCSLNFSRAQGRGQPMAKAANLLTNIEQLCNAGLRHFRVRTAAANIYKREAAGIFLMSLR